MIFLHKIHCQHIYIAYVFIQMSLFLADNYSKTVKWIWQWRWFFSYKYIVRYAIIANSLAKDIQLLADGRDFIFSACDQL